MNELKIGEFYNTGVEELRVPLRLASSALSRKQTRALHLLLILKAKGSRVPIAGLEQLLPISRKTLGRWIEDLQQKEWIGSDGVHLFPRSWDRIGFSKIGGVSLCINFIKSRDHLEAFALAASLKRFYRRKEYRARKSGRAMPKVFPSGYFSKALEMPKRTFERHKHKAVKYGWIRSKVIYRVLGKAGDYEQLRKNLHGPFVMRKGRYTVTPEASEIDVLI